MFQNIFQDIQAISVNRIKCLMFMQITGLRNSQKLLWCLSNCIQYVNDKCYKITRIHWNCLFGQTTNYATLIHRYLENTSNFEGWSLTLVLKKCAMMENKNKSFTNILIFFLRPWSQNMISGERFKY